MNRRALIIGLLVCIISVSVFLISNYDNRSYKKEEKTSFNTELAFILIDEDGKETKTDAYPSASEYILNFNKSFCLNGSVIGWDSETGKVKITANKSDKCKLYFTKRSAVFNLKENILATAEENNYLYSDTTGTAVGIYKMEDDLGDSYYFKGDITNNYVKLGVWTDSSTFYAYFESYNIYVFDKLSDCETKAGTGNCTKYTIEAGNEMYWKIVRINGDETIRLAYTGVENKLTQAGFLNTKFNEPTGEKKNVGYTYDKSDTDTTQVDSIIKGVVDNWYNKYLKSNYSQFIADGIFCNDRELIENESGSYNYAFDLRKTSPILKCENNEDKYTTSKSLGNGYLSNPIGLLTADEVVLAASNLKSGLMYWTMTPDMFNTDSTNPQSFMIVGDANSFFEAPDSTLERTFFVRPVINIRADVLFNGTGTASDPYTIVGFEE